MYRWGLDFEFSSFEQAKEFVELVGANVLEIEYINSNGEWKYVE